MQARPYAKKSLALLSHLLDYGIAEGIESRYWNSGVEKKTASRKVALVVVTSNKGLAGSFNSGVVRAAAKWKIEQ